jgi:hypothetical protein
MEPIEMIWNLDFTDNFKFLLLLLLGILFLLWFRKKSTHEKRKKLKELNLL